ncbi:hypothetical protein [Paludisphaera mucosa]|uniref:Uncharacterized protein n=1 Tax=Paludisphaera mucosa TaxID=3030827 RepID=A0ABT6FHN9_9BACT|nr:hypothetical protein [Paludisphaera mucosa]MDG3007103.1 hypothetical protein [Paludisphaera mucosa]
MNILVMTLLTSPLIGNALGVSFALTLLLSLAALSVYAGLYYSLPRMLMKWLSRRAIPAV